MAEIRRLGEAQRDNGLLQARGVANQEMRHREEKDALQEEARVAKQQLKELKQRWQEKQADFQQSDRVAAMNARLLKEVKAERDVVTQLKAAAKAAADQHRRDNEAAEKREEWMGQMCNAMKAAERAKAAKQESWATKEME